MAKKKQTINADARKRSIVAYIVLAMFLALTLGPVLSVTSFAFLPQNAIKKFPPQLIPTSLYLDNFAYVWRNTTIPTSMLNSLIVVAGAVILVLVIGSVGAYGAAKSTSKHRAFVYAILLVTQMIPAMANMIPIYTMMTKMGLLNSRLGLILIYTVNTLPLSMLILIGFFKNSIEEIEEAAMIDGCNWWQAFVRISLPISKPGLVSSVIFTFALSWNEFMMSKLVITKPQLVTFQVSLYNMLATYVEKKSRYDLLSAAALIGLIPVLIIYITFQKGFTEGITTGSIK
ncbi:MAG: carbohydrate ABC transporter permease [Clostridia bacterium]